MELDLSGISGNLLSMALAVEQVERQNKNITDEKAIDDGLVPSLRGYRLYLKEDHHFHTLWAKGLDLIYRILSCLGYNLRQQRLNTVVTKTREATEFYFKKLKSDLQLQNQDEMIYWNNWMARSMEHCISPRFKEIDGIFERYCRGGEMKKKISSLWIDYQPTFQRVKGLQKVWDVERVLEVPFPVEAFEKLIKYLQDQKSGSKMISADVVKKWTESKELKKWMTAVDKGYQKPVWAFWRREGAINIRKLHKALIKVVEIHFPPPNYRSDTLSQLEWQIHMCMKEFLKLSTTVFYQSDEKYLTWRQEAGRSQEIWMGDPSVCFRLGEALGEYQQEDRHAIFPIIKENSKQTDGNEPKLVIVAGINTAHINIEEFESVLMHNGNIQFAKCITHDVGLGISVREMLKQSFKDHKWMTKDDEKIAPEDLPLIKKLGDLFEIMIREEFTPPKFSLSNIFYQDSKIVLTNPLKRGPFNIQMIEKLLHEIENPFIYRYAIRSTALKDHCQKRFFDKVLNVFKECQREHVTRDELRRQAADFSMEQLQLDLAVEFVNHLEKVMESYKEIKNIRAIIADVCQKLLVISFLPSYFETAVESAITKPKQMEDLDAGEEISFPDRSS